MVKAPLISIITINLNNLEGLKKTMKSVFEQTWKGYEYIIIDGDSIDGSKEYIESFNSDLTYWVSERDHGIYNAMNKGIKVAQGEYLLFLNSGDEFYDRDVLLQNFSLIHTYDIIYFNIYLVFKNNSYVHHYPPNLNYKYLMKASLGHPTTFIKSDIFQKIGYYDEKYKIVSDWKFFITAIIKFNCSYFKVNETLSKFYMDGLSTNEEETVNFERTEILNTEFSDYIRLKDLEERFAKLKKSLIFNILLKMGIIKLK